MPEIRLAEEHTKLSEKTVALQEKNQRLIAENQQLKDRLIALEPKLKQTKKELAQANDLLIDMTTELNNWKMQVLGFKDEMRQADQVQLETLFKILKVLGGDVSQESTENEKADMTLVNKPDISQLKETLTLGKSNE